MFVSSDYESIAGGDIWFTTIVNALKTSLVEIVLLSPTSVDRPWINFEAGVGIGTESLVIPVRRTRAGARRRWILLSSLQIRSLEDNANVRALLKDLPERNAQTYMEAMSDALRGAGFTPRLAARHHLGPTFGAGYKVVYMTDRKTYRVEIDSFDVLLTAKPNDPKK